MLNQSIREALEITLDTKITDYQSVSGGSINHTGIITTSKKRYFLKRNQTDRFPKMFETEAKGLQLLAQTEAIGIPQIIHLGVVENEQFLVLENIESGKKGRDFWQKFGEQLAALHKNTQSHFGLDHSNYIGSLPQFNHFSEDWTSFFIENRLEPQIKIARDEHLIDRVTIKSFEKMYQRLDEIFPTEEPSLIHGDLWNGNFMVDKNGQPVLIDPAVAYAHREMDIAMSKLFGGFGADFYESYYEYFPSEAPNETNFRLDICNLYYLMVHVNLFGESYLTSIKRTLEPFR